MRAARQAGRGPRRAAAARAPARLHARPAHARPASSPIGEDWYREQGIEVVDVDRGGKVTYHGPGQLVGYPIVRTDDVIAYVRTMEHALVARARATRASPPAAAPEDGPDYTGVWVGDRKIASIGVHVARGVTTHGFAVNVDNDLDAVRRGSSPAGCPTCR